MQVHGTQTVVDEAAGTSKLHGGLVGDWAITSFMPIYISSAQITASGTESFSGCLDLDHNAVFVRHDPTGPLQLSFIYWASFNPATGALIEGRCAHPITGAGGTVDFLGCPRSIDLPTHDGGIRTTYKGNVGAERCPI